MNFVPWNTLYEDTLKWERQLPEFDAICGVPRSGLIPASILALRRNVRMVAMSDLLSASDLSTVISSAPIRATNPIVRYAKPYSNRLLIVDDSSSNTSSTLNAIRSQLNGRDGLQISYAAVYSAPQSNVDYFFREVRMPRMFGWNWFRHWDLQFAISDIDGVLCEDWLYRTEMSVDPEYVKFIETVKPLYLPAMPVRRLVTGRLERYREKTKKWLASHGVRYSELIMHPADTPESRRKRGDTWKIKANVYAADLEAKLFIESSRKQAEKIFEATGRPVLCIDTQEMFSG